MKHKIHLHSLFIWSLFAGIANAQSTIIPYPAFKDDPASTIFSVSVNGKPVYVHHLHRYNYVHFAFAGKAEITITVKEAVQSYKISPLSHNVAAKKGGRKISFSINEPRSYILRDVNAIKERLIIIADPLEEVVPDLKSKGVVNVSKLPGVNFNKNEDVSAAINKAIESLPNGSLLYFPAGRYSVAGTIKLKSYLDVYLEPGAELYKIPTSSNGLTILAANNLTNVKIFGRGRLTSGGREMRKKQPYGWMDMLDIYDSKNVVVEDLVFFNSPSANIWIDHSDSLQVYNVKLLSEPDNSNSDGIDMESSRNNTVDNVFMCITDDASNLATNTKQTQKDCENIEYTNVFYVNSEGTGAAVALAGGINKGGKAKNAYFENYDVVDAESFIRYMPSGGGDIDSIYVKNVRNEFLKDEGIWIELGGKTPEFKGIQGQIKNLFFDHIYLPGHTPRPNKILGWTNQGEVHTVSNIQWNHLYENGNLITDPKQSNFNINEFINNVSFTATPTALVNLKAVNTDNNGYIEFTRSQVFEQPLAVNYKIRGNAKNGTDYSLLSGQITIPANAASVQLPIKRVSKAGKDPLQAIILLKRGEGYVIDKYYIATVNL